MVRSIFVGVVISLMGMIGTVQADEKPQGTMDYSVTAYGLFNTATNGSQYEGKVYRRDDGDYPGWSGHGGGVGIGFGAMWRGYFGIEIQMLYSSHQLSGTFDDPLGGQLKFDYELSQFDFPILFKAAYPTRYVTPLARCFANTGQILDRIN